MAGGRPSGDGHRTVNRVAALLELAAAHPRGIRLADGVAALDAPTSSVHSLLRGLVAVGYLHESDGRYRVGPALGILLGRSAPEHLVAAVRPELERLAAETGETAILGTRVGDSVAYLDQVESSEPIRYAAPLHERRSLERTSIGKLYLAQCSAAELRRVLGPVGGGEAEALRAELEEVRRSGTAYNRQETVVGIVAAASGIRAEGRLIAAVSVAGPGARMSPKLEAVATAVRASTGRLASRVRVEPEPPST